MAVIAFEMQDLKEMGYPKEKLEEITEKLGVEIEEMTEKELKINVTPNRPDLLDFTGFLRALDNFTGENTPKENHYSIKTEPVLQIEVTPAAKKARPYISGVVVRNVDLKGNMLKYMINFTEKFADTYGRKRRKLAIGLHSLDAISGNLTYDAAPDGKITPLNMPKRKMGFDEVMKQHEKGMTYQATIPHYGTSKAMYPHLKDQEKVIALIPITNCEETRVTEKTKDLFIDITGTSAVTVAAAANLIACSFMDMGAEVFPVTIEYPSETAFSNPSLVYKEFKVLMSRAEKTLGAKIEEKSVIGLANKTGYVASQYGKSVLFYVPPYRVDVISEQDIIEDIAIAYGYDRIVPLPVYGTADGLAGEMMEYENKLVQIMLGLGYTEAINSMLSNEKINFDAMACKYDKYGYVSIADAKTVNISMVRTDLLPGLLQDLSGSVEEKMPQRLFEVGRVFNLEEETLKESVRIATVSEHSKANFAEVKAMIEEFLVLRGIKNYKMEPHKNNAYIEGRCAKLVIEDQDSGIFGEIHPLVLQNFGLEEPVVAAELVIIREIKYEA